MKLGILVNTDQHLADIIGLTKSALSKGHEVTMFTMDEGTNLFRESSFTDLSKLQGVTMSFCDHSAKQLNAKTDGLPGEITSGSQYDNAAMYNSCDKAIVL